MKIGQAVAALEAGMRVQREGWNGKRMHLELQVPDAHSKMTQPYVFMFTADGNRVPWNCSQSDLLAADWRILDDARELPPTLTDLLSGTTATFIDGEAITAAKISAGGVPEKPGDVIYGSAVCTGSIDASKITCSMMVSDKLSLDVESEEDRLARDLTDAMRGLMSRKVVAEMSPGGLLAR